MKLQSLLDHLPQPDQAWMYHQIPHYHAGWGLEMRVEQEMRKRNIDFARDPRLDEIGIDYIIPVSLPKGKFLIAIDVKLREKPYLRKREKIIVLGNSLTIWEIGGRNEIEVVDLMESLIMKTKIRFGG